MSCPGPPQASGSPPAAFQEQLAQDMAQGQADPPRLQVRTAIPAAPGSPRRPEGVCSVPRVASLPPQEKKQRAQDRPARNDEIEPCSAGVRHVRQILSASATTTSPWPVCLGDAVRPRVRRGHCCRNQEPRQLLGGGDGIDLPIWAMRHLRADTAFDPSSAGRRASIRGLARRT
jgi:hypothetical protein